MTYLRVEWEHSFENEPIEMLSELDGQRNEVRKIERFRNGIVNFAGPEGASGPTVLSEVPLPNVEEIAADPMFHAETISRDAFEDHWKTATLSVAA